MPEGPLGGGMGQVADCDGLNSAGVGLGWRRRPVREMLPCRGVLGTLGADVVTCWKLVSDKEEPVLLGKHHCCPDHSTL